MTKEDIQRVLELALEYYKLEVFGTGKESENPNQERIDWIYNRMKEKQVNRPKSSDNLEEAASEYISAYYAIHHREPDMTSLFVAGAQWQKDRINIDISKQVAAAYQLGEKGKEEQMLKDAVDTIVENWNPDPEPEITIPLNPEEFTPGDKVRVIIIKEEG